MTRTGAQPTVAEVAHDRCALSLVRRLAALLDRDPAAIAEGQPLPRGWHVVMFNAPTRQSDLRPDGASALGVVLPELGLPRLMMGGRSVRFAGDIPVGSPVRRETRLAKVSRKEGRSGHFALVDIEHHLIVEGAGAPALIETVSYILRPGAEGSEAGRGGASLRAARPAGMAPPAATRRIVPDETLLFRYSAITDNPHRIHYDLPYARKVEKYPALLVNGTIPAMFLLEMLREVTGHEPAGFESRNLAPIFCGTPLTLSIAPLDDGWAMLAEDAQGQPCLEARAW